jgi:anti-sigma B factor antagonist
MGHVGSLTAFSCDGTLFIVGEVDAASAPELERCLEAHDGSLSVDLEGVRFLDAAGVRVLLEARRRRLDAGHELRIVSASRAALRVLEILGLTALFEPGGIEQADRRWSLV